MSGLTEIKQWVEDSGLIIPEDFDNTEDLYDSISSDFEANNRLPLDDILQDEKGQFMEFLESRFPTATEPQYVETRIFVRGYTRRSGVKVYGYWRKR